MVWGPVVVGGCGLAPFACRGAYALLPLDFFLVTGTLGTLKSVNNAVVSAGPQGPSFAGEVVGVAAWLKTSLQMNSKGS